MNKFFAYAKTSAFYLLFAILFAMTTPFYWHEGGKEVLALAALGIAIFVYKALTRGNKKKKQEIEPEA